MGVSIEPGASVHDDGADRFTRMHQVKPFVNAVEWHGVGDQIVDVDLAVHVPIDNSRHLGTTTGATESRAAPNPAGDKLERTGCNLLPSAGDTDDDCLLYTSPSPRD